MAKTARRKETLADWATGVLLHAHAIAPCPDHGFMKIVHSRNGLDYAHALAEHQPYPGKSKASCVIAVDEVFDSFGDQCPACE